MTIYTLAEKRHQTYGQGEFGDEIMITQLGSRGSEHFPRCFVTYEEAEKYRQKVDEWNTRIIVELEVQV